MTTATAKEVKEVKLSPKCAELADRFAQRLTMDKKTGQTGGLETAYVDCLPAGITKEIVEEVREYTMNAGNAGLYVLEAAIPVMKANKDITDVKLVIPMTGNDTITAQLTRERHVPGKDDKGNDTSNISYGSTQVKIDTYGLGKRGDMAKIKKLLAEQAQAAFGS